MICPTLKPVIPAPLEWWVETDASRRYIISGSTQVLSDWKLPDADSRGEGTVSVENNC